MPNKSIFDCEVVHELIDSGIPMVITWREATAKILLPGFSARELLALSIERETGRLIGQYSVGSHAESIVELEDIVLLAHEAWIQSKLEFQPQTLEEDRAIYAHAYDEAPVSWVPFFESMNLPFQ